jgi:hypothetical protein
MLPGEADAAAKFLQSRIPSEINIHGSRVQVSDEKSEEVELLLEKFLHHEGLQGYRVLRNPGTIRVVPDNRERPHEEMRGDKVKGILPYPPLSKPKGVFLSTVYPNYLSEGVYKKKHKKSPNK